MIKIRFFALLTAVALLLTMFAACGGNEGIEETTAADGETAVSDVEATDEEGSTEEGGTETGEDSSADDKEFGLEAEKIGSTDYAIHTCESGIYYTDKTGKFGVMTFDGKTDTGAIYDFCAPEGEYFTVVKSIPEEALQPSELNCKALIDVEGNEIIPAEYAGFAVLNERYIRVYRVMGLTEDETEALLDLTDSSFSLKVAEGNQLFKGEWEIYDLEKGAVVEGIIGTKPSIVKAYGNYISYTDDNGGKFTVNGDGKALPTGGVLFDNGCYVVTAKNKTTVYDTDDTELFVAGKKDYKPVKSKGEYFLAEKSTSGDDRYVYLDKTGKPVSGAFASEPEFHGDYTVIGEKIYDYQGNLVFEESYKQVYYDSVFGRGYFLRNDDEYTLVKNDGSVVAEFTDNDSVSISALSFIATKREDDGTRLYYSVNEEDYTLTGYILDSWLVEREVSSGVFEVIDVYTGEAILSGYKDYITVASENNSMLVYAKTDAGIYDIYRLS